jgi:hypothetical protein
MASAYGGNVFRMTPVWVIDRNGSGGMTDPLITADTAVMASVPLANTRPSIFYLPNRTWVPDAEVAGITPIYRGNGGSFYTKLLTDYGFQLEETLGKSWPDALDDTTRLLLSPQRTVARPRPVRRGIRTNSERELGHGYLLNYEGKFVEVVAATVESATQTNTISIDLRAGGQIGNWRVQMSAPVVDRQLINRADYGRAFQSATFLIEESGQPGEITHNPTQAGDNYSNYHGPFDVDDWEAQASPLLTWSSVTNPDGSVTVVTDCFPLEFQPQLTGGGGLHEPVGWFGAIQRKIWTFNWNGREGVHRCENWWYQPFALPHIPAAPAPGPQVFSRTAALFLINEFDQLWIYDAANNTEKHAVQAVEMNGYAGGEDYDVSTLTTGFWAGPFGLISPPAAHPMPSGTGGVIWRDSGTHWGSGDDFSVGHYFTMFPTASGENLNNRVYDRHAFYANYTTTSGVPEGKDGATGLFHHAANWNAGNIGVGWNCLTSYVVTGIYANVKAAMRQLYLDGIHGVL